MSIHYTRVPDSVDPVAFSNSIAFWMTRYEDNFPNGPDEANMVSIVYFKTDVGERMLSIFNLKLLTERTIKYVKHMVTKYEMDSCGICATVTDEINDATPVLQGTCCRHCMASVVIPVRLAEAYRGTMASASLLCVESWCNKMNI